MITIKYHTNLTPGNSFWRGMVVITLLAVSNLMTGCTNSTKTDSLAKSELRILTYNVWYGFTQSPRRKPDWLAWMKAQRADIVFLQELNEYTPEQLKEDAAFWGHPYSALLKQGGFPTGISSKYPIEDIQITLQGFHHGLIRARIKDIYYYTIHLHPSNWTIRNQEMDLILQDMDQLPRNQGVILAGDFNTFSPLDSGYYSHKLLEPFFDQRDQEYEEHNLNNGQLDYSTLTKLMDHGFTDAEFFMRQEGYTFSGTFPTLIEKPGDHGQLRRLDYVFVSKNLTPSIRQASIIANDTTQYLSDHLPMIVDLELAD